MAADAEHSEDAIKSEIAPSAPSSMDSAESVTLDLSDPRGSIAPSAPSSMDSAESVTLDLSDPRGSIDKILMADALALKSMCEQMGVTYKTKQASAAELLKLVLGLSAETQAPNDEEAGRTASPTAVQSTTPTTTTSTQDSTLNQAPPPKSTVQRYNKFSSFLNLRFWKLCFGRRNTLCMRSMFLALAALQLALQLRYGLVASNLTKNGPNLGINPNITIFPIQGAFLNNHRFQKGAAQDHKSPPMAVYS